MKRLDPAIRDELRAAVLAPEPDSASEIADRFGVSRATVQNLRRELRAQGLKVMAPTFGGFAVATGSVRPCERCGAEKELKRVGEWEVCDACEPKERARIALPAAPHLPAGPVEPLAPTDLFRCEHYRCSMAASACVRNQSKREVTGGFDQRAAASRFNRHREYCRSGTCAQGALIKLRVEAWQPTPAEQDLAEQRLRDLGERLKPPPPPPPPAPVPLQPLRRAPPAPPTKPAPEPEEEDESMARKSKLDDLTDDDVRGLEKTYVTANAIAEHVGCSASAVRNRLKKLDRAAPAPAAAPAAKKEPGPKAVPKLPAAPTGAPAPAEGSATPPLAEPFGGPWPTGDLAGLPRVERLPSNYLLACVEYAMELRRRFARALGPDIRIDTSREVELTAAGEEKAA